MTMATEAKQQAHGEAMRRPVREIAAALQETLGQRMTAIIAGTRDEKAVGKWARGERAPQPEAERRLRAAWQVAGLLLQYESRSTVHAWFMGMNPVLDDEAPALLIAEAPRRVIEAAESFVAEARAAEARAADAGHARQRPAVDVG